MRHHAIPLLVQIGPSSTSKTLPGGMFAIISPVLGVVRMRFEEPGSTRPWPPTCNRDGKKPGHTPPTGRMMDGVAVGGNGVAAGSASVGGAVAVTFVTSVGTTRVGTPTVTCAGMIANVSAGLYEGCPPSPSVVGKPVTSSGAMRISEWGAAASTLSN